MQRIVIVYFDAGGGHRAAARALSESIRQQGRPWQVISLNLDDVLEPVDPIYRATGVRGGEMYNRALRMGWTAGSASVIPVMHGVIRMLHSRQVRLLQDYWRRLEPDLVVSVVPHFNRALFESLRAESWHTPFVTVITDLADYPPHFWFEEQDQDFICGSEHAGQQARIMGAGAGRVWHVSGMVLHPRFYDPIHGGPRSGTPQTRPATVPAHRPGIVWRLWIAVDGGYRAPAGGRAAPHSNGVPVRPKSGARPAAEQVKLPFPVHVEGFTEDVVRYMWLSDFFIGKPGPGSVSEALAMRLPVIVHAGTRTWLRSDSTSSGSGTRAWAFRYARLAPFREPWTSCCGQLRGAACSARWED